MAKKLDHPADRLEANTKRFVTAILRPRRFDAQVMTTTEFAEREKSTVVQINAHEDIASDEMGYAFTSMFQIAIASQIDDVDARMHKEIVAAVRSAIWREPRSVEWVYHATPEFLCAMNRREGQTDRRAACNIHLLDFLGAPSEAFAPSDATAVTMLVARAKFMPIDGKLPYVGA